MIDLETILLIAWIALCALMLVGLSSAKKDAAVLIRLQQEQEKRLAEFAQLLQVAPHKVQELEEATGCKVCNDRCCDKPDFVRRMACGCMESRLHSESCYYYACKNCRTICECEPE